MFTSCRFNLSLSSPNRVDTGQVERPKFDIKEETVVELRSLGFSWEGISCMLLVSRWTIHRRVSELGLTHLSRFSDIIDEQLDRKVPKAVWPSYRACSD